MAIDEHAARWSAVDKLDEIRKLLGIGVQDDVVAAMRKLKDNHDNMLAAWDRSHLAEEECESMQSANDTIKAEYAKLKAVAEGQDNLISELRLTLANAETQVKNQQFIIDKQKTAQSVMEMDIKRIRERVEKLTTERDSAELSAIYFAKRLESQYHGE